MPPDSNLANVLTYPKQIAFSVITDNILALKTPVSAALFA